MNPNCRIGKVKIKRPPNVVALSVATALDVPPSRVLAGALEKNLRGVVVLGYCQDGSEFFSSSYADGGECLWLLERAKHELMRTTDEMAGE